MKMVKIGSFLEPKFRHWSKFRGETKIFLPKTVSKIISVRFIIITLVKTIINWFNLTNYFILGENGKNWVILGAKMTSWVGRKYCFLKTVSKVILVRFINITVVKNVINGFNLIK